MVWGEYVTITGISFIKLGSMNQLSAKVIVATAPRETSKDSSLVLRSC